MYVPLLQHFSSRSALLAEAVVALPTSRIYGLIRQNPEIDGLQLRKIFNLLPDAKIILVSVAKDKEIESLYKDLLINGVPKLLSRLDILHVTSPNFSFPNSLPRTESLINRSRIVKVSEQLSAAGLSVVMHLNATHQQDWDYWRDFLRERSDLKLVAKEFQTGLKGKETAHWHMRQFSAMQESLGRSLGLLAVGGRASIPEIAGIKELSVIDSNPFMKATKRSLFDAATARWSNSPIPKGMPIDGHLLANIIGYRADVERRIISARTISSAPKALAAVQDMPRKAVAKAFQADMFPEMYLPVGA